MNVAVLPTFHTVEGRLGMVTVAGLGSGSRDQGQGRGINVQFVVFETNFEGFLECGAGSGRGTRDAGCGICMVLRTGFGTRGSGQNSRDF